MSNMGMAMNTTVVVITLPNAANNVKVVNATSLDAMKKNDRLKERRYDVRWIRRLSRLWVKGKMQDGKGVTFSNTKI